MHKRVDRIYSEVDTQAHAYTELKLQSCWPSPGARNSIKVSLLNQMRRQHLLPYTEQEKDKSIHLI